MNVKDGINTLIVGVGGQGTLLASRILGHLGLELGCDVKLSEVHGMAQRGGSVVTHVRIGPKIYSPLIDKGGADTILAFELLEALRWKSFLKKDGSLFVNTQQINPMPVILGSAPYPEGIVEQLAKDTRLYALDALSIATQCGSPRAVNVVLLGVLASTLEIDKEIWLRTLRSVIPEKIRSLNLDAFEEGYTQTLRA